MLLRTLAAVLAFSVVVGWVGLASASGPIGYAANAEEAARTDAPSGSATPGPGAAATQASAPVVHAHAENPVGAGTVGVPPASSAAGALLTRWRSGALWRAAPATVAQPTPDFAPGYPTPQDFIDAALGDNRYDVRVVIDEDPSVNCGVAEGGASAQSVGSCYNPLYGPTLFIWWGVDSEPQLRQFALLHEFSHFVQWWDHFDAADSALQQNPRLLARLIEPDAACRVLDEWHNAWGASLQDRLAHPCDVPGWTPGWFESQLRAAGVVITAY